MKILETDSLNSEQKIIVCRLWNNEYPKALCYNSVDNFDAYLNILTNQRHHILLDNDGQIKAWGFEFTRDLEKWFAIIVNIDVHLKGFGTILLDSIKQNNTQLNGWVIDHENDIKQNGDIYKSPLQFYIKNKFKMLADTRLDTDIIKAVKITWTENAST